MLMITHSALLIICNWLVILLITTSATALMTMTMTMTTPATHLIYPPSPQLAPQLFFATQKSNPVSSSLKSNAIIIIIWWRNTNTCPTPPAPLHGWSPCFPRNPAQCDHQCDHDHLEKLDWNIFYHKMQNLEGSFLEYSAFIVAKGVALRRHSHLSLEQSISEEGGF